MNPISWTISKHHSGVPWRYFGIVGAISWLSAIYFVVSENYFAVFLFVITPIVFFITSTRGVNRFVCEMTEEGIVINSIPWSFTEFEYFSMVDDMIVLKPIDKNEVFIPVYERDRENIINVLSSALPEQEHEENLTEIVARMLKLH